MTDAAATAPPWLNVGLAVDYPDEPSMRVSHETIYQSLFVQARGALRRELAQYLPRNARTGGRGGRPPPARATSPAWC
jgi:IS30 family transposase